MSPIPCLGNNRQPKEQQPSAIQAHCETRHRSPLPYHFQPTKGNHRSAHSNRCCAIWTPHSSIAQQPIPTANGFQCCQDAPIPLPNTDWATKIQVPNVQLRHRLRAPHTQSMGQQIQSKTESLTVSKKHHYQMMRNVLWTFGYSFGHIRIDSPIWGQCKDSISLSH